MTIKKYIKPVNYFKDYCDWPKHWMESDEDLATGNALLVLFTPFIESLIKNDLSVRIIKNHMGNLSVLGGEIIRRLNDGDEKNRKLQPKELLLEYIDEEYGPLVHHWDPNNTTEESYLKSFDGTCRKLYKFILALK